MRRKVSRFYVGGINKSSSVEGMRSYLDEKGVKVTFLRYFDRHNRSTASAQLNIDAADEHKLANPSFWPAGVFVKQWLPWEVFRSEIQEKHNLRNGS